MTFVPYISIIDEILDLSGLDGSCADGAAAALESRPCKNVCFPNVVFGALPPDLFVAGVGYIIRRKLSVFFVVKFGQKLRPVLLYAVVI